MIREVLVEAEQRVLAEPLPWHLQRFVGALHVQRSAVLTFNYDTLLERALAQQRRLDWQTGTAVVGEHVIQDRPPQAPARGMFGTGAARSFRLLKLHGSVDTFWVPGDLSGATINRFDGGRYWSPGSVDPALRHLRLPGRSPFIVPPAATKSAFYGNPLTQQLWREASQDLRLADRVDIVGYSLPLTDLVVSGLIQEAVVVSASTVNVVNPDPSPVLTQLRKLGIDDSRLVSCAGSSAVEMYVEEMEQAFQPLSTSGDALAMAAHQDSELLVALSRDWAAPVTAITRHRSDPATAVLTVGEKVRAESLHPFAAGPAAPPVRTSQLLSGAPSLQRLLVAYQDGKTAYVLQFSNWGVQTLGRSNWVALVPSAVPWSHE